MVTDVGTIRADNPLLLTVATAPPAGAACESVTVQVLPALDPSVLGLHCKDEITVDVTRLRLTLVEVLL